MISTRNAKNIIPRNNRNPWSWIPTLYFAEGLPYVAVMTIAVIMYKRLGLSNTEIALYTSWLYLPWTIKPLWSPFVDLVKTKRSWIIAMQGLIAAGFAGIAFFIPTQHLLSFRQYLRAGNPGYVGRLVGNIAWQCSNGLEYHFLSDGRIIPRTDTIPSLYSPPPCFRCQKTGVNTG